MLLLMSLHDALMKGWQYVFIIVSAQNKAVVNLTTLGKKATIHQVTTMVSTSKKSYFQVITTGADDPMLGR